MEAEQVELGGMVTLDLGEGGEFGKEVECLQYLFGLLESLAGSSNNYFLNSQFNVWSGE